MSRRKRKLRPAKTCAKDHHPGIGKAAGEEGLPLRGIGAKRLGGDGVVKRAGQVRQVRGDANVDGGKVVRDRRAAGEVDQPRVPVNAGGAVEDETGTRSIIRSDRW